MLTSEGGKWEPVELGFTRITLNDTKTSPSAPFCGYKFENGDRWYSTSGWKRAKQTIPNSPSDIFAEASKIIYGDREKTYGHPAKNLQRIAEQWTLYFKQKYGLHCKLSPEDVCWMMADLKKARQMNEDKHDNILDAIGYIGRIDRIKGDPA